MRFDPDFYRRMYPETASIQSDDRLYKPFFARARERFPSPETLIAALEEEHGRLPGNFDAAGYIAQHEDLRAVFTCDWQGKMHYLQHGRREGRIFPSPAAPASDRMAHQGGGRISLVLEGFDGSGKSTLAAGVAAALGGRVVRPFGGSLGEMLLWLARTDQPDLADRLAREAVLKGIRSAPAGVPLVFDRHWVTACHILPVSHHADWQIRPDTVICWADLATTRARLRIRGDVEGAAAVQEEQVEHFRIFALERGLPLLDTSRLTPAEATARLIRLIAEEGVVSA